jgi:glycosyltransferase involved in cell wall biosynthesis
VLIFCPEGGLTSYQGAQIYGLSAFPLPLYPELKLALPRPEIGEQLEKFQPDLIHVVNPAVLGLAGIYYAKSQNIPLLASYHTHLPKYLEHYGLGVLEGLLWELLKGAHNQARLNLCTSTAMVEELRNHGIERVDLWQRGVDTETFHPDRASLEMRHHLSQGEPGRPLLLYVGRLGAEKEIERIKPVLEAIPGARLAIIGDGPHRGNLEQYFAGTPTNFVGYLHGQELAAAYASADAFIFPSRTETLGLVLLEAMAAGCPVVAAKSGGIPDIVTDGKNGYLFDPQDESGAIAATKELLDSSSHHSTLWDNAHTVRVSATHDLAVRGACALRSESRREAERWSWSAATKQLQDYYQVVVRG